MPKRKVCKVNPPIYAHPKPKPVRKIPRPKRPKAVRADDDMRIFKLVNEGYTQHEIAALIGVSLSTVQVTLQRIRSQALEKISRKADKLLADEILKLEHTEREAWREWNRSKEPIKKMIETVEDGPTGATTRRTKSVEERVGNPQYLMQIQMAINQRTKLLGLQNDASRVVPQMFEQPVQDAEVLKITGKNDELDKFTTALQQRADGLRSSGGAVNTALEGKSSAGQAPGVPE